MTKSESNLRALVPLTSMTGVPVIDVNGTVIIGFNRPKLDRALGVRSE
ncbi:MAG: hypothetical protein M1272_03060 [Firmicutes bacterium]|nr:hypothetical protein [Bacillota bacterium]